MPKLKILKQGETDINSTDIWRFAFHSEYPVYKIISSGSASMTMLAGEFQTSYTITHNLGYVPMVFGFVQEASVTIGGTYFPGAYIYPCNIPADLFVFNNDGGGTGTQFIYCYADETTMTIVVHNQLPVDYLSRYDCTFNVYWRIAVDEY